MKINKTFTKFEILLENGSHSRMEILGCDTMFSKNLVGLGQSPIALNQSQIALTSYSKLDGALGNFTKSRKIWLTRIKLAC
jgi:hypothetical protein